MSDTPPKVVVPTPTEDNPFRSPNYIAKVMDVKAYTVREWLRSGRLTGYLVTGQWKILQSDFVAFLQKEYGSSVADQG